MRYPNEARSRDHLHPNRECYLSAMETRCSKPKMTEVKSVITFGKFQFLKHLFFDELGEKFLKKIFLTPCPTDPVRQEILPRILAGRMKSHRGSHVSERGAPVYIMPARNDFLPTEAVMSGSVGQGVLNFKIWKHLIWGRNGPCKKLFKIFSYIIWVIIVSRPNLLIFLYPGFEDVSRPDFSYQFLFIRYPKFKDVSRPCQFLNKNANPSRWVSNPVPLA